MSKKPDKKVKYGYMCRKEFQIYVDKGMTPTPVYASEDSIKKCRECVKECGIVKVKIEIVDES